MVKTVSEQMSTILEDYEGDVKESWNKSSNKVGRESVNKLKNTSPKGRTGSYARGWSLKKIRGRGGLADVIVHNRTDYQLTHLLENGHLIKNKYGEYGRTNGTEHIAPVERWGIDELPREIERELE
jgi:hypothetical protein